MTTALLPTGRLLALLALLAALCPVAALSPLPAEAAGGEGRSVESLIEECRSPDLFFRERAEGEVRQRGAEALPALAAKLSDPDRGLRLRLWSLFRDLLRIALDDLDADAGALFRDRLELALLKKRLLELPPALEKLRGELGAPREPRADPEEERQAQAEIAEKAQRLRAGEESLRDAQTRAPEIEGRIPERALRTGESLARILALGAPAFGPLYQRREAILVDLELHYQELLEALRAGLSEEALFPSEAPPAGEGGESLFERTRHLLSAAWAREVEARGPHAARAEAFLERHLKLALEDLRSGDSLLRRRAEEDLFYLGRRGVEAIASGAADLPPGAAERLRSLLEWRIDPRLQIETGLDFRDYESLPFRARRRLVIRYGRVAGRAAIPTLRLIAQDERREPSLRVRLAAAETLAGPNIRDRSALRIFERMAMPELVKIPEIARDLAILKALELIEEKRYAEAVEELKKVLDEAPYHFRANYQIAFAYLLLKNYSKSIFHFEVARRLQPGDDLTLYNLACAYSLDGQVEKALEALEASVQAGFTDFRHMEADPDLAPLRSHPRFHEIVDRLKKG